MDYGESLTAAAVREVKEEAGVDIDPSALELMHVMHRSDKDDDQERLDFYCLAHAWQGDPHLAELDKSDRVAWFTIAALPEHTLEKNMQLVLTAYSDRLLSESNW